MIDQLYLQTFNFKDHADASPLTNAIIADLPMSWKGEWRDLRDMRRMRDLIAFGVIGKVRAILVKILVRDH